LANPCARTYLRASSLGVRLVSLVFVSSYRRLTESSRLGSLPASRATSRRIDLASRANICLASVPRRRHRTIARRASSRASSSSSSNEIRSVAIRARALARRDPRARERAIDA
jgi:hypothetical protein